MGLSSYVTDVVVLEPDRSRVYTKAKESLTDLWHERNIAGLALIAGIGSLSLSIAIAESLLVIALVFRIRAKGGNESLAFTRPILWCWFALAAFEIFSCLRSPDPRVGLGEMRHLLLPAAVFASIPALRRNSDRVTAWRMLFLGSLIGSGSVISSFLYRLIHYRHELALSSDPSLYLRTGGLLHHWMVYGTVEVMVFAGLLEFWRSYPEERRSLIPIIGVNALAIMLSLTRILWIASLVLLILHLFMKRSRWIWAAPVLPLLLLVVTPVRARIWASFQPDYYSNTERIQMLRVGWKMVTQHPLVGIGPGRVDALYITYLSASDPVPAYHGHLHNNVVQIAAQFGLPTLLVAITLFGLVAAAIHKRLKSARHRELRFLCSASLLGLLGFILAGMCEYTYGHSLGILLASFLALSPLGIEQA